VVDHNEFTRGFSSLLDGCAGLATASLLVQVSDASFDRFKVSPVPKTGGWWRWLFLNFAKGFNLQENHRKHGFLYALRFELFGDETGADGSSFYRGVLAQVVAGKDSALLYLRSNLIS
jgi:hypothetical protein